MGGTFCAFCVAALGGWLFPRYTNGVSNCTRMSVGFACVIGSRTALPEARATCDPAGPETTVRVGLGMGGNMGSRAASRAEEEGRCTFGGRFASETVCTGGGAVEARMTAGGGGAHPQSTFVKDHLLGRPHLVNAIAHQL